MQHISHLLASCLLFVPTASKAAGLAPWNFGMSQSDVAAFADYGPYKAFSNGDLETYSGLYDGRKENVQFFFDAKGLRRIGIYLYEGQDSEQARVAWRKLYASLRHKYGEIETPSLTVGVDSSAVDVEALSIAAAANTIATGKTQMAPLKQPQDMFVFSSFTRRRVGEADHFYVVVNFDRRQ